MGKRERRIKRRKQRTEADRRHQYGYRNAVLKRLGFDSYADYLKSELWSSIRARVIGAEARCSLCPRPASQVHHLTYTEAGLRGESLEHLIPVCGRCHGMVEFRGRSKVAPSEAWRRVKALADRWERRPYFENL